jgi:enoyl-CoA hydratase
MSVNDETDGPVVVITIDRPDTANAIDRPTNKNLVEAFARFEKDEDLAVAVLTGANGKFWAGPAWANRGIRRSMACAAPHRAGWHPHSAPWRRRVPTCIGGVPP